MEAVTFDPTWRETTAAQMAAFQFVLARKPEIHPPGLTQYLIAEMMCMLPGMLVYRQMSAWAEHPPERFGRHVIPPNVQTEFWQRGCRFAKAIVDLGYTEEGWWPMHRLAAQGMDLKYETVALAAFGVLLYDLVHAPAFDGATMDMLKALVGSEPLPIVPASWWTLFDLWLGRGWYANWKAVLERKPPPKRRKLRGAKRAGWQ